MSFDPVSYAMGTKAAGGGGGGEPEVLVCTFSKSGDTIRCDKTGAEIVDAYNAGMEVIGLADYGWVSGATMMNGDAVVRLTRVGYNSGTANMLTFTGAYFFPGDSVTPDESGTFALTGLNLLGSWRWTAVYVPASFLPSVTSSDNGKVLGVSGGTWGAVENEPYLKATYTATPSPDAESALDIDSVSCDKTYSELFAQLAAGKPILAALQVDGGVIVPMGSVVSAVRSADGSDAILITLLAGATQLTISHDPNDDVSINIEPIIYHYMEYNSTTQTLNIVTL